MTRNGYPTNGLVLIVCVLALLAGCATQGVPLDDDFYCPQEQAEWEASQ